MNLTNVYLVMDVSGSMAGGPERALRDAAKEYVATLRKATAPGVNYNVIPVYFGGHVQFGENWSVLAKADLDGALDKAYPGYPGTNGNSTALRTAVYEVVQKARKASIPTLVSVFTDGAENSSYVSVPELQQLLAEAHAEGLVTVTCAGPKGALEHLIECGVPAGNVRAWDGTAAEMAQVSQHTVQAVETYSKTRAAGKTSTARFYADASALTPAGIKSLTVQAIPKRIDVVPKRMAGRPICDFFGGTFTPGTHYYELIKPEYVQEDKELIIYIEDQKEYRLGSRGVRQLLNLPVTGKVRVHPAPGQAAQTQKYKIYVQSSSNNRKLVEGQTLLTVES